jgi:predicted NBD/HSP70 family sugar kinase
VTPRAAGPRALWLTDDVPSIALQGSPSDPGSLLQQLRDGSPRTRAELARSIGVSRSTVAAWIDQQMAAELVAPVEDAASTGGRPSSQFAFRRDAYVVLAADVGASHARIGVTDLAGSILAERREDLQVASGPVAVLDRLEQVGRELLSSVGRTGEHLIGIGVGVPGPVEFATGRPVNPPIMPGWDRFDIRAHLEAAFGVPVVVDNEVNVMSLGERALGWPGVDDLLFVKVATGIGAGVISGGSLRRGAHGAAGDLGHAPLGGRSDVVCTCGNAGCLEAIASGSAIAAGLRSLGHDVAGTRDVIDAVRAGDSDAIAAVRQAGRDIGAVLTVAVSLLNPDVIVIGGSMAQVAEHLVAGVREVVYARSIPLSTENLTIVPSRARHDAGLIGAAHLAMDAALSPVRINRLIAAA